MVLSSTKNQFSSEMSRNFDPETQRYLSEDLTVLVYLFSDGNSSCNKKYLQNFEKEYFFFGGEKYRLLAVHKLKRYIRWGTQKFPELLKEYI